MNIDRFVKARRAGVGLGALVCTLALCTACVGASTTGTGSTATGAVGSTATTSSAGESGSTTPAGGTSPSGAGATSPGSGSGGGGGGGGASANAAPSTCSVRYLNGTLGSSQGTAGSVYVNIVFKNLNTTACTLYGYPGVSFGKGGPGTGTTLTQVGAPADKNAAVAKKVITLQPGGYAYAILQVGDAGNYPSATCDPTPTTYLMVYPPNTTNQLYIPYKSTACASTGVVTMHVEAVEAGTGS